MRLDTFLCQPWDEGDEEHFCSLISVKRNDYSSVHTQRGARTRRDKMKGSLSGLLRCLDYFQARYKTGEEDLRSHTSLLMLANLTEEAEAGIFGLSKKRRGQEREEEKKEVHERMSRKKEPRGKRSLNRDFLFRTQQSPLTTRGSAQRSGWFSNCALNQ